MCTSRQDAAGGCITGGLVTGTAQGMRLVVGKCQRRTGQVRSELD